MKIGKVLPHTGRVYCVCDSDSSTASLIREIVLSRLRRLVLGLVIVVPRLAVLLWLRLDGFAGSVEPGAGDTGTGAGGVGLPLSVAMTRSRAAETPLAGTGDDGSSDGDGGFDIIARPS